MHTNIVTTSMIKIVFDLHCVLSHIKIIGFDNIYYLTMLLTILLLTILLKFVTECYCVEFLCKWILNLNGKEWFSVVFQIFL